MPLYALGPVKPRLPPSDSAWIAPGAHVIGDVLVGENVSIWFGAMVRGDNEPITIGDGTNIQEGAVLHADPGAPLVIGSGVTVGHGAILHGCTVGSHTLVGMGAIVLNSARVGSGCVIGAGALITEGKSFPDGSLILGSPARAVRQVSSQEFEAIRRNSREYGERGRRFAVELSPLPGT